MNNNGAKEDILKKNAASRVTDTEASCLLAPIGFPFLVLALDRPAVVRGCSASGGHVVWRGAEGQQHAGD